MTRGKIFTKWDETHSELWAHQPIRLEHEMHKSPAFSMDDLARLIESYPRDHYSLVQIAGRKRVYVYPNSAPFITPEHLEDIALFNVEVDLPYKDWYDDHAKVLDIGPGQMLGWPMNAPHRVENLDTFSVSMTISYTNDEIRRAEIVNLANGMLRHRFGYTPKTRNLRGPSFLAKAVMQKLLRDGKWVKRERSARRPIDFTLDAAQPGKLVDLKKAA